MNVLFVAFDFKPRTGGIAEYTHRLADQLEQAGHAVTVLSGTMDGASKFDATTSYKVDRFDYDALRGHRIRRPLRIIRAEAAAIRRYDADVVVCNTLAHEGYACWAASRMTRTPWALCTHGSELSPWAPGNSVKDRLYERKAELQRDVALRGADLTFSNSSYTHGLVKDLGVPEERIWIVNPGFDMDSIPATSVEDLPDSVDLDEIRDRPVVITVSRLIERKGIDRALEAIDQVRRDIPEILYVVAGDGEDKGRLHKMARDLGLEDHVVFTGYVDERAKHALYGRADLFVMPNRDLARGDVEGFGIVFLEANAHRLPVIAGRAGGAVDAVADGASGFLVDPTSVTEIADAITRVLGDDELRKRLGTQGRTRVEAEFTWESAAAAMERGLRSIIR